MAAARSRSPSERPLEEAEVIETTVAEVKDYPTPPNCTSPFAPIRIAEIVRRKHESAA